MFCRIISCLVFLVTCFCANVVCNAQTSERFCGRVIPLEQAQQPFDIGAVADLDSDGDLDYVFVTGDSNRINVYFNDGQGNGQFDGDYAVGVVSDNLTNLVVADLDGDSDLDIAVGNSTRSEIRMYFNSGDGKFVAGSQAVLISGPKFFEAVDVDADSDLDFVCLTSTGIKVFANIGSGVFFPRSSVAVPGEPTVLSVGDVNGDSFVDIVAGASREAFVFHNNGNGVFEFDSEFSFPGPSVSLKLFDKDGDADLDLVVGNRNASQLGIYVNQGGTFSFGQEYFAGSQTHFQIEPGDINGDSQVDLVIRGHSEVLASYADGDGGYYDAIPIVDDQPVRFIAVSDADGDSDLDVVSDVGTYVNEGTGRFGNPLIYFPSDEVANGVWAVTTADVDGDNDQDMIYAQTGNRIGVRRNNGQGEFDVEEVYLAQEVVRSLVAKDFNGDGAVDLAYIEGSFDNEQNSRLLVRLNNGDGTFGFAVTTYTLARYPVRVVACKLDGNDSLDLAVSTWGGDVVFSNNGNGFFVPSYERAANSRWIVEGDTNGDGVNDLVVGQNNGFAVLNNNGQANFASDFYSASNVRAIEINDLDNDGDLDIVLAGSPDGQHATVYTNDGNGVFQQSSLYRMGNDVQQIRIVDVNDDSILDLSTDSREFLAIRLGRDDGSFGELTQFLVKGDFTSADLNNDSLTDFVFANVGCQILFNGCVERATSSPASWSVFRGQLVAGGLADLINSDDSRVSLLPGFTINSTEAPVWVVLDGALNRSFDSLELSLESNGSTPNLERTIEAWNWNAERFDVVNVSSEVFANDTVVDVDITTGEQDFVQPSTGATRARVGWRQSGFLISFPWRVNIDQFRWVSR